MENKVGTQVSQKNEVAKKDSPTFAVQSIRDSFTLSITKEIASHELKLDEEQKSCLLIGATKIFEALDSNPELIKANTSKITAALTTIAMFRLNAGAYPSEVYFIARKDKEKGKTIDWGIEGDGNDKLLIKYGVGVKSISKIIIREGDEFTLPYFNGEKYVGPTYKPKTFSAKPLFVIYIIKKTDGTSEYLSSDYASVASNIQAQIIQNLMNYEIYWENNQKKTDLAKAKRKAEILAKIPNMSTDELLSDQTLAELLSPAYLNASSRNLMIIRKMRNNAIKSFPKDFGSAFVAKLYGDTYKGESDEKEEEIPPTHDFTDAENELKEDSDFVNKEVDENGVVQTPAVSVKAEEPIKEKATTAKTTAKPLVSEEDI